MKNLHFVIVMVLFALSPCTALSQRTEPSLETFRQIKLEPKLQQELQEIVRIGIQRAFGEKAQLPADLSPLFEKPFAIFVTFEKEDLVRGCMGSLRPQRSILAEEILRNVELALRGDPRHEHVSQDEAKEMKVFVTAVGAPLAIRRWDTISPARDAVYLRHGSREAIVLPGEAKTQRYLLDLLKSKAGVKAGENFQLYRVPTVTVSLQLNP
jgi:AMMECR1 domain-containing protein